MCTSYSRAYPDATASLCCPSWQWGDHRQSSTYVGAGRECNVPCSHSNWWCCHSNWCWIQVYAVQIINEGRIKSTQSIWWTWHMWTWEFYGLFFHYAYASWKWYKSRYFAIKFHSQDWVKILTLIYTIHEKTKTVAKDPCTMCLLGVMTATLPLTSRKWEERITVFLPVPIRVWRWLRVHSLKPYRSSPLAARALFSTGGLQRPLNLQWGNQNGSIPTTGREPLPPSVPLAHHFPYPTSIFTYIEKYNW